VFSSDDPPSLLCSSRSDLSLIRLNRDRDSESASNGLVVARLKRALGQLSRALNAASRLKQRGVELPIPIGEWITEMLKVREELLLLMSKFQADFS
jgi:hypothetical protein